MFPYAVGASGTGMRFDEYFGALAAWRLAVGLGQQGLDPGGGSIGAHVAEWVAKPRMTDVLLGCWEGIVDGESVRVGNFGPEDVVEGDGELRRIAANGEATALVSLELGLGPV